MSTDNVGLPPRQAQPLNPPQLYKPASPLTGGPEQADKVKALAEQLKGTSLETPSQRVNPAQEKGEKPQKSLTELLLEPFAGQNATKFVCEKAWRRDPSRAPIFCDDCQEMEMVFRNTGKSPLAYVSIIGLNDSECTVICQIDAKAHKRLELENYFASLGIKIDITNSRRPITLFIQEARTFLKEQHFPDETLPLLEKFYSTGRWR